MRLEPVYSIRFHYPEAWNVSLTGKKGIEEDHYSFAEGQCEGGVSGKFRGSNHPHRRTDETFMMNIQGFIETASRLKLLCVSDVSSPSVSWSGSNAKVSAESSVPAIIPQKIEKLSQKQ